jgi:tetratricopeptide (TPR) repeat protein
MSLASDAQTGAPREPVDDPEESPDNELAEESAGGGAVGTFPADPQTDAGASSADSEAVAGAGHRRPTGPIDAAADLEAEREFFLRSLQDLEAEHSAGDIDDVDYLALRDDYTTRAADVLRRLADLDPGTAARQGDARSWSQTPAGRDTESPTLASGRPTAAAETGKHPQGRKRRPWTRTQKALLTAAALALAAGAGWQVGQGSSSRLSGQSITGQTLNAQAVSQLLVQGEKSAASNPVAALKDFNRVLASYPDQPQALTDEGWVLAQGGLLAQARAYLEHGERSDPGYPLTHAYLGIVLGDQGDYQGAVTQLQYFLAHHPEPALVPQARAALNVARRDLKLAASRAGG